MEHPQIQTLFICGLICCHGNPNVKECLLLFRRQNHTKIRPPPKPNFSQIYPEIKNSENLKERGA